MNESEAIRRKNELNYEKKTLLLAHRCIPSDTEYSTSYSNVYEDGESTYFYR